MLVAVVVASWVGAVFWRRRPVARKAAIARAVRRRVLLSGRLAGALSRSSTSLLRKVSSMCSMLAASMPWTVPLDATHHGSLSPPCGCWASWSWPFAFGVGVAVGRSSRLLVAGCWLVRGG